MFYRYCPICGKKSITGSCSTIRSCQQCLEEKKDFISENPKEHGQKESDNKLSYELDRNFIEAMAKRMQQNKGKYPPYNRQKPMDIENLKQALLRHTIEVMKGNYTDIEDYDHLSAIACNAQFIYYQLSKRIPFPSMLESERKKNNLSKI